MNYVFSCRNIALTSAKNKLLLKSRRAPTLYPVAFHLSEFHILPFKQKERRKRLLEMPPAFTSRLMYNLCLEIRAGWLKLCFCSCWTLLARLSAKSKVTRSPKLPVELGRNRWCNGLPHLQQWPCCL